jgi:hypothetical protein
MHQAGLICVAAQRSWTMRGAAARVALSVGTAAMLFTGHTGRAAMPLTIAVADFDYVDTSGEIRDQSAEHRARVASFADLLRAGLGASGAADVRVLECPERPCTASRLPPEEFAAAVRRSGARLVVYGGIRKMSTLVQWGEVDLLDLDSNRLLLQRTVTFRGDTDAAYQHAAEFVGRAVKEALPKP